MTFSQNKGSARMESIKNVHGTFLNVQVGPDFLERL